MVSGFFTSPTDHERIRSGEASAILIASKSSAGRCWLKRLSRSFILDSGIRYSGFEIRQSGDPAAPEFVGSRLSNPGSRIPNLGSSVLLELHVDGQRADFLDQHVERLRHARDHLVLAVDD